MNTDKIAIKITPTALRGHFVMKLKKNGKGHWINGGPPKPWRIDETTTVYELMELVGGEL